MQRVFLLVCALAFAARPATGQSVPAPPDSMRSYELGEIVISTAGADEPAAPTTVHHVALAALGRQDATSVSDVMRLVPSTHVQTNSRGESLVYLRNAGERQVALFFDGALLNVPWDNRLDLSLVPSSVVGGITIVKGVPSVLYGTNVLGGAINLTSRMLGHPGRLVEASLQGGAPRSGQAHAAYLRRTERLSYTGAFGYATRTGDPLPGSADLAFSQADDDLRTNTDRRLLNLFGSAVYRFGEQTRLGVSLLHLDGEKGVAPESHLDPSASNVRFWRYPTWRTSMLIVNGQAALGPQTQIRGALWGSRFTQQIAQYESDDYAVARARQEDEDGALGGRLMLAQAAGPGQLRLAVNALTAGHRQQDLAFDAQGALVPFDGDPSGVYPTFAYRQHTLSTGAEYEARASARTHLLVGGSLDAMWMPETGDKPARDPFTAYSVTTGATYAVRPGVTLRGTAGRKVRFPTLRELFGEALNRFQLNPSLRPETSFLSEAAVEVASPRVSGEVVLFFNRTYDTIDQRTLPDRRRERINLEGSRVFGIEAGGLARPLRRLSVEGHLAWMRVRAFADGGTRPLTEKPEWLGTLTFLYDTRSGFSLSVQPIYTGRAYSLDEDGAFRRLPSSLVVNARLAYRLFRQSQPGFFTECFVRVDNVTDAYTLPQLGLPGPGRELRAGVNVTL